jgi:hypothetical protein
MKLSDAILLGSTILTPRAGQLYSAETHSGCALGMAAVARGCTFRRVFCRLAPANRPTPLQLPHIFDYHGMAQKDWTLEQLVMWVKQVEHDFDSPPASRDIRDDPFAQQLVEEWQRNEREWQAMARDLAAQSGFPMFRIPPLPRHQSGHSL